MSKLATSALAVAAVAFSAGAAKAVELPDGMYACTMGPSVTLGDVWIHGHTYVGPSFDEKGPSHDFEVTPGGTINWGAPMGGMDTDGNKIVSTNITDLGHGKLGFDIVLQVPSGRFHTVNCG